MNGLTLKDPPAGPKTEAAAQAKPGLFRFSVAQFLAALVALIVTYPFISEMEHGDLIEDILMMVLLISGALAIGGANWRMTILLILPAIVCPSISQIRQGIVPLWLVTGSHVVFVAFVVMKLIRFVLHATRVNSEVMCAGIAGYLMLGVLWTPVYLMVSELNPHAFSGPHLAGGHTLDRFDAVFFSFVSLTCLGCNDITAMSRVARMLLMIEALTGVLYLAVLIARLVSLYSRSAASESAA